MAGPVWCSNTYTLGQPLFRRPKHSGSLLASFHRGRLDANISGYARSRTLDVEPNFGAPAGIFTNPGYRNVGINLNYRVRGNLTVYANVHNALNQRYEEIYENTRTERSERQRLRRIAMHPRLPLA